MRISDMPKGVFVLTTIIDRIECVQECYLTFTRVKFDIALMTKMHVAVVVYDMGVLEAVEVSEDGFTEWYDLTDEHVKHLTDPNKILQPFLNKQQLNNLYGKFSETKN